MAKPRRYRKLKTVDEVFLALGGTHEVARLTGRNRTAVCNWRSRRVCAAAAYKLMIDALEARGHTAPPSLWGQAA